MPHCNGLYNLSHPDSLGNSCCTMAAFSSNKHHGPKLWTGGALKERNGSCQTQLTEYWLRWLAEWCLIEICNGMRHSTGILFDWSRFSKQVQAFYAGKDRWDVESRSSKCQMGSASRDTNSIPSGPAWNHFPYIDNNRTIGSSSTEGWNWVHIFHEAAWPAKASRVGRTR